MEGVNFHGMLSRRVNQVEGCRRGLTAPSSASTFFPTTTPRGLAGWFSGGLAGGRFGSWFCGRLAGGLTTRFATIGGLLRLRAALSGFERAAAVGIRLLRAGCRPVGRLDVRAAGTTRSARLAGPTGTARPTRATRTASHRRLLAWVHLGRFGFPRNLAGRYITVCRFRLAARPRNEDVPRECNPCLPLSKPFDFSRCR
jgi:hypothetical protein